MSRSLNDLTPDLRVLCQKHLDAMDAIGIKAIVTFTLRTGAEQAALYAQGRQPLDVVNALRAEAGMPPIADAANHAAVTWTMASKHLPGPDGLARAYDIAVKDSHGVTWDAKADGNQDGHPDYEQAAQLGRDLGLEAGYFWRQPDAAHFQLDPVTL